MSSFSRLGFQWQDCGNASDDSILRTPTFSLQGDKTRWTLPIDATPLTTGGSLKSLRSLWKRGQSYKLCLDLDGDSTDLSPGKALGYLRLGIKGKARIEVVKGFVEA